MKRYSFLLVPALALWAAGCDPGPTGVPTEVAPSFAAAGGVLASVSGSGHIPQGDDDRRVFTFAAQQRTDGTASGQFVLLITQSILGSENPSITRIEADVTCMSVSGNRAWVGGVVKNASNPDWIGRETGWAVEDNGEGSGGFDLISLMNVPGPPGLAQAVCDTRTRVPNLLVDAGDVRVSAGGPVNDVVFPFWAVVPVCGDLVEFVGTFHPVFQFRADGSGGFHAKGHYNATGVGVSLFGDAVYQWNDAINFQETFRPPQATFTSQQSFLLVGRGQAPDQRLHFLSHVTVTPDGVWKITADDFRVVCS